jgi:protein-disulfide isomerase
MSYSQPQLTKAQRREAARLESARVAELNAARDARNKKIIWGVLAALVAALVLAVVLIARPWQNRVSTVPNFEAVPMSALTDVPANTVTDGGIAITAEGSATAVLNPNVPTVDVYFDYACPWCWQFEFINLDGLQELVANQEANVILHPVAILNGNTPRTHFSTRSVAAAGYVADRAPMQFLEFHKILLENQPTQAGEDRTQAQIAEFASRAGVPAEVVDGIASGDSTRLFGQWAVSLTAAAGANPALLSASGGFGTPTITVDGVRFEGDWSDPSVLPAFIRGQ